MPPVIALLLCIFLIVILFRLDTKRQPHVSGALWIPLVWMLIIGSRFISQWFGVEPTLTSPDVLLEGSPLDRAIFLALITAGIFVLLRRRINWAELLRKNKLLILFLLYCGGSILWSDYPFVSIKRWIKMLGNVVMVLVILTDYDPLEAAKTVLRRVGFILVPLSVVLIKYYPDLGRGYNQWTWKQYYCGVSLEKNGLGALSWITGIYFFWSLLALWGKKTYPLSKEILVHVIFLIMIVWLLTMSNSATSLITFIAGVSLLLAFRLQIVRANIGHIGILFLIIAAVVLFLELSTDFSEVVLAAVERDDTLTDRIPLWNALLDMSVNPLVGAGYESFWLGERIARVWDTWKGLNQAHNGYLETYLNLGIVGLFLLVGVIGSFYVKSKNELISNFEWGSFRMAFLLAALLSNITEATFHGINLVLLIFFLIGVEYHPEKQVKVSGEASP